MRLLRFTLVTSAIALAAASFAFTLDVTKLPSQQGFNLITYGNRVGLTEGDIYSVGTGVLNQHLTGQSYGAPGHALFTMANPNPDSDFSFEATVKVVGEEAGTNWSPYGFSFGVVTNYGYAMFGLAHDRYAIYNNQATMFDASAFHTYRLDTHASTATLDVYVDGQLVIGNYAMPTVNSDHGIFFADATGYTNTDVEINGMFGNPVPEPATGLIALLALPLIRRMRKS